MDSGLRRWAQPGKMQGRRTADWNLSARLTWLLRVLSIASLTYRSTIDDDQQASDLICWMGTPTAASQRAPETRSECTTALLVNSCEAREVRECRLDDFVFLHSGAHCARRTLFRKDVIRSR